MSFSQLRVALGIAAGVIGASLLGATFVGCQSNQPNGPYGQYNRGPNGSQMAGMPPGDLNSLAPQNRQAFLNETQRVGAEQGLSMQDVVAMKRSGLPDQQIAMAIQQRGGGLAASPGAAQYLAQNGINPAVLNGASQPAGMPPGMTPGMQGGMPAGMPPGMTAGMNSGMQPGMQPGMPGGMPPGMSPPMGGGSPIGMPVNQYAASSGSPPFQPMNNAGSAPIATALNISSSPPMSPMTPEQGAPIQPAGFESSAPPGFESAAPTATGSGAPGQMWRPMGH